MQFYRYFMSQSSEFCRHNPLCCFSTSVSFCCLFRYRLSPETFGYTIVNIQILGPSEWDPEVWFCSNSSKTKLVQYVSFSITNSRQWNLGTATTRMTNDHKLQNYTVTTFGWAHSSRQQINWMNCTRTQNWIFKRKTPWIQKQPSSWRTWI
jgi:hypothetical protein